MRCSTRFARSVVPLCALFLTTAALAQLPEPPRGEDRVMREALVLPAVGTYGRRPFHTDALQAAIADGTWVPPAADDAVTLPDGSTQTWTAATAGDDDWFRGPDLRGGYVFWTVDVPTARVMMLHASGQGAIYANGTWRPGDPYANGWVQVPVRLRKGVNGILFHCSRGQVKAKLVAPPRGAFFQLHDRTMPDLIHGEPWAVQGGILIANASPKSLIGAVIRAGGAGLPVHETPVPTIPPLTVRKVPFWFGGPVPPGATSAGLRLELTQAHMGVLRLIHTTEFDVGVRRPDQTHKRTFISAIDGSVQYYAVTPMVRDGESAGDLADDPAPALFLTLHGASVEGAGQARVYASKNWGHVVAPTNRRPFGFDWEDWGRLDAIEVLELNQRRLGIDPDRTYLTGHSMGGHGTWHIGVTFPDRFAAIGPSAGWRSFWAYTGAERFAEDTPLERILRMPTNPSDTVALSRNTRHYGVYILHGEKDDNVPADQARFMNEHLRAFHPDVVYHEEPGAGHWWGNRCCDWDPMFDYFASFTRAAPEDRAEIEFHTANPGISASSAWITIEQQIEPLAFSTVEARVDRDRRRFVVTTENVARLAIDVAPLAPDEPFDVEIDGATLGATSWPEKTTAVAFVRAGANGSWSRANGSLPPSEKGPHRYGPFKDAFRHRVIFVYGTQGSREENMWAATKARFDAETFWYRGNAAVDVVSDEAFDPATDPDRSVIVYGNAETNSAWDALLRESPVQVTGASIAIGNRTIDGDELGALFIRPRPGSDVASVGVVAGTGLHGARLTDRLPYFVSGVGYPDCVVFGPEILREGVKGVRAAGIFGLDWSVERGQFAWADGQ